MFVWQFISEALNKTSYVIQRRETDVISEGQGIPYLFAYGLSNIAVYNSGTTTFNGIKMIRI